MVKVPGRSSRFRKFYFLAPPIFFNFLGNPGRFLARKCQNLSFWPKSRKLDVFFDIRGVRRQTLYTFLRFLGSFDRLAWVKSPSYCVFLPFWPSGAPKAPIFGTPGQFLTKKNFASKTLFYAIGTNLKLFLIKKILAKNYFFRPPGENFFRPARPARRPLVGPAGAAKIAKNVITGTSNPSETIKQPQKPQKSV